MLELNDGQWCGNENSDKRSSILRSTRRFDEYEVSLLSGYWAMLNASWNDEHLSRAETNTAIAHFNGDIALEYQEEVVRVFMLVPGVRPHGFGNHDFVAVEARHRCGLPRFRNACQNCRKIDRVHVLHVFYREVGYDA